MESKRIDPWQIIGFVLIAGIFTWMIYSGPQKETGADSNLNPETYQEGSSSDPSPFLPPSSKVNTTDSLAILEAQRKLGDFAYSFLKQNTKPEETTLENNVLSIKIQKTGGYISEVRLKDFHTYDSIPVYLIHEKNSFFNLSLPTSDGRLLETKDLPFNPILTNENGNQVLSMRLEASEEKYLEYRYTIPPKGYLIDFEIRQKGLSNILSDKKIKLDWRLSGIRHSKSVVYENRYTRLSYAYESSRFDKLSDTGKDEELVSKLNWASARQHFFSSILLFDKPLDSALLSSDNLVKDEGEEVKRVKDFGLRTNLNFSSLEGLSMNWYFGPTDYPTMKSYEKGIENSIPFGWGVFGWINKYLFTPLFAFLSSFLPFGIAIIVMTVLVRIVMSPVTYKSYLSQVKMKVLRPEITEINEKYKDDAMKRQQETMKLYNTAGVNPMAGCVPALLQIPIFYALFMFFPSAFVLRQKSFLWAEDLSAYDSVAKLPFSIPFYGDHVALFPILASLAIFVYMLMTTGQQMQVQQPGMPNMKFLIYLSPLMMLFFFNNYASGLSLYYFVSNLITILIMLVIKNYVINEQKIHAQVQANKQKPKKQNRFQRKMQEMMEQAEQQRKQRK